MRQHVINTIRADGGVVTENDTGWDDAISADEIFLTNSQIGVVPIQSCGTHHWQPGPVTSKVLKLMAQNGIEECGT